ncbi:MAG TPA: hypothetical protein DCY13_04685 [Verrucomicrobiales bacterium]|nr:hypothetical protein [Verrucomicrobiales bacterium]
MFKLLVGIIIGLALVAAGWWYFSDGGRRDPVDGFQDAVKLQGEKAVRAVEEKIGESVEDLKEGMDKTGERISQEVADAAVLARVKAGLFKDKSLDGFRIDVDVTKGQVKLSGTVPSAEARARAFEIVRKTEGVKGLSADLKIARPTDP